ncbi:MAG: hypothetical protein M1840_005288 [Geoglossum simile]|nr:MAG: hypothetical protein M1840_005288 [Geoglossum simile]
MAMPLVRLDTTVADLYRNHGIHGLFLATTHGVFAHMDLHPEFPRETVYPEDEEPVPYGTNEQERAKLKKVFLGQLPWGRQPNPCFIDLNQGDVPVKLPLAASGYGTWLVTTEARRRDMLAAMTKFMASHFVVDTMGMREVETIPFSWLSRTKSHCKRSLDGRGIDYSAQSTLKSLLRDTVCQTARLPPEPFVGWAGPDIVIDEEGKQWVVDLNPRFTGSIPLCLLSDHFFTQRWPPRAEFAAFPYEGATEDIYTLLSPEIRSGKVVVTAVTNVGEQSNMADLVWGGRDEEDLAKTTESIKLKLSRS